MKTYEVSKFNYHTFKWELVSKVKAKSNRKALVTIHLENGGYNFYVYETATIRRPRKDVVIYELHDVTYCVELCTS